MVTPQPPAASDTSPATTGRGERPGWPRGGKKGEEEIGAGRGCFSRFQKVSDWEVWAGSREGSRGRQGRQGRQWGEERSSPFPQQRRPRVPEQPPSASLREDGVPLTPKQSAAHPGDTGDAALLPGASKRRPLGRAAAGHGASRAGTGHPIPMGSPGDPGLQVGAGGMAVPLAGGAVSALPVAPALRAPCGNISGSGLRMGEARWEPRGRRAGTPPRSPRRWEQMLPPQAVGTARHGRIWQLSRAASPKTEGEARAWAAAVCTSPWHLHP